MVKIKLKLKLKLKLTLHTKSEPQIPQTFISPFPHFLIFLLVDKKTFFIFSFISSPFPPHFLPFYSFFPNTFFSPRRNAKAKSNRKCKSAKSKQRR